MYENKINNLENYICDEEIQILFSEGFHAVLSFLNFKQHKQSSVLCLFLIGVTYFIYFIVYVLYKKNCEKVRISGQGRKMCHFKSEEGTVVAINQSVKPYKKEAMIK